MKDLVAFFAALRRSPFRQRMRRGASERSYLLHKALETVLVQAADVVRQRLAPAQPLRKGKQTPMGGHPVRAQAVTAQAPAQGQLLPPAWPTGMPVPCMQRTRDWYLALGYDIPSAGRAMRTRPSTAWTGRWRTACSP